VNSVQEREQRILLPGFDLQQIDQDDGLVGHGVSPFRCRYTKDDPQDGNGSRRRRIFRQQVLICGAGAAVI
jgi:hypothetical protein